MNFGNCCIRARKAHTSMRKFSKENLTVNASATDGGGWSRSVIVDAHLIPMKFRTERRQPLKIFYNAVALEQGLDTRYRLVYYKTAFGTIAQLDRASDSGSEGRRFESA